MTMKTDGKDDSDTNGSLIHRKAGVNQRTGIQISLPIKTGRNMEF
jgi:hypothetical protein